MEVATSGGEEKTASEMAHWCWAAGSAAQLGWGIWAYRRAYAGECRNMPVKAFGVASLFIGAGAAAVIGGLKACGIHQVEDLKVMGENIRTSLGAPPRKNTRSISLLNHSSLSIIPDFPACTSCFDNTIQDQFQPVRMWMLLQRGYADNYSWSIIQQCLVSEFWSITHCFFNNPLCQWLLLGLC